MKVVIVCAGAFPRSEYPRLLLKEADSIVCCDGALATLEKNGIVPDVVTGDFDSVCRRALKRFPGKVVRVEDQECNDLTKAFRYVMDNYSGLTYICILGATGKSEAHSLGNLSLLMQYEKDYALFGRGITVEMVSDYNTAFAISQGCTLYVGEGRKISVFTCDSSLRLRSKGLQWPLDDVVFDNWWKGSLNRASEDSIELEFSHSAPVLIILD